MPEMRVATAAASAPGISCTKTQLDATLVRFILYSVAKESSAENWSNEVEGGWPTMPVTSQSNSSPTRTTCPMGSRSPKSRTGQRLSQHYGVGARQSRLGVAA